MPSRITAPPPSIPAALAPAGATTVPLDQAIPALLARLAEVAAALDGAPAPFPPPGFQPVPDAPPSRRERALLVHFAWTAYTVLAGRPPAEHVPDEWPFRLSAVVPLLQRRPDLLPALARLVDRVLTAPPLAPLPSPAGFEELLRRAAARTGPRPGLTPPRGTTAAPPAAGVPADVVVTIDFSPSRPEAPDAVVARLELLAGVLASSDDGSALARRRGLFRLGWTGWERLYGEPPFDSDTPYVLRLDDPAPLRSPRIVPLDAPARLVPLLSRLLDQRAASAVPSLTDVRAELARCRRPADLARHGAAADAWSPVDASPAPSADGVPPHVVDTVALLAATADEASRWLDALARQGLVSPGPAASTARSLDERLAVASLAWSVYRAATGEAPITVTDDETGAYRPLTTRATGTPVALAAAVDATLAPESPSAVPGLATWLAAATAAADDPGRGQPPPPTHGPPAMDDAPTASVTSDARHHATRAGEASRRRVRVLPEEWRHETARRNVSAWWIGAAAAAATVVTAWRLSGGP